MCPRASSHPVVCLRAGACTCSGVLAFPLLLVSRLYGLFVREKEKTRPIDLSYRGLVRFRFRASSAWLHVTTGRRFSREREGGGRRAPLFEHQPIAFAPSPPPPPPAAFLVHFGFFFALCVFRSLPVLCVTRQTRIREVMIQGILATEMSEHGTHITKVDKLTSDFPSITLRIAKWAAASGDLDLGSSCSSSPSPSPPLPTAESTPSVSGAGAGARGGLRARQVPGAEAAALGLADCDRLTVASALLHAADLSSPGRPFATCEMWVLRLLEEFKFQAEKVCMCVVVVVVCVFGWRVGCCVFFSCSLFFFFFGGGRGGGGQRQP